MPNPSTYPYRRFPTIQVGAADHAARGTDAVKQELHALCAGSSKTVVTVECYPGTDQAEILALFPHAELVIHADDLAILPAELDAKIEHELTDDPVFGIMTTWQMKNFYPEEALCAARGKIDAVTDGLVLVYGVGASLVERADITIYADITRWEIQLRFRKGQDNWHTAMHDLPQRAKYKRGYFAEWRWGDRIKDKLLPVFDYYLDTTSAGNPAIVPGTAYRDALSKAAAQPFRMVPYFDPGVWGGDWMKTHFDLPENGSNYAWSFDGVPEENSLLLDFGSCVVETPALNLVYAHPRELLGDRVHARFGKEFPIRFDMLDTMHGQNLSLQVHPLTEYIQSHFHMHYVEVVNQYLAVPQVSGELAQKVMNEALKYQGWKYVYGGSNPNTSFDCSGLTQWCYGKAGISLPRTAQAQYDATQHLPLSQAKAGDLVFFHSTYNAGSYVTHVGILVSPTQMYHAGDPIGYADLSSSYWQQHLIGAGRVKQ